jgi:hypothetical protein
MRFVYICVVQSINDFLGLRRLCAGRCFTLLPCSSILPYLHNNLTVPRPVPLPVVIYGCDTWSLTVREEHKLRVFENRVLRKIFGPKRDRVTGGWRELHNEELHNLYSRQV